MKLFKRERFSIFKAQQAECKKKSFERMCRAKLDGELVLQDGVFYLDGQKVFQAAGGIQEWKMWQQFYNELDDSPWLHGEMISRARRSKKNWGYGSKSSWKSSRRDIRWNSAERRRERMARDQASKR